MFALHYFLMVKLTLVEGGLFAQKLSWRWLFCESIRPLLPTLLTIILDINIPLTIFSLLLVFFFLKLKTPTDHIFHKLSRVDWLYVSLRTLFSMV